MSTLLSQKDGVRARKEYYCDLCGEKIEKATLHDVRTGINDGMYTMRMHPECHRYEQKPGTVDRDWYEDISSPAFERSEAIANTQDKSP